ncbi:MAG: hypothetical protein IJW67_08950, partial [Blautia sp.]|nr:hypothetical protein [Blautia sp.]
AIFRIENGQAALSTDVAKNGIMNYSAILRKVILRKVSDTYESLSGAEFQIYRNDGSLVSIKGDKDQELTSFESGVNGVYFIGDLPYGIYYLHETKVPGSMKPNGDEGWWYYLIVHESGIYVSGNDTDHKGGYTSENLAEEAAKEKYEAIKSTQTSDNSSGTGSGS